MTDVRELIERGRYTAEHGVFDAVDACKYATVAELTDALSAALEREEALLETMRLIVAMADGEDAVLDENGDDICPFELARAALENTNGN